MTKYMDKGGLYSQNLCKHASVFSFTLKDWKLAILDNVKMESIKDKGDGELKIIYHSKEEERKLYENDNLSPFPDENGVANYPCTKYDADKYDI